MLSVIRDCGLWFYLQIRWNFLLRKTIHREVNHGFFQEEGAFFGEGFQNHNLLKLQITKSPTGFVKIGKPTDPGRFLYLKPEMATSGEIFTVALYSRRKGFKRKIEYVGMYFDLSGVKAPRMVIPVLSDDPILPLIQELFK